MSADHQGEEAFCRRLADLDEALAEGRAADLNETPPLDGQSQRWEKARSCLRLLALVWPRSASRPAKSLPPAPSECIGPFMLMRILGRGTFGTVYLAEDERLRRLVALKIPHPHVADTPDLRQRFLLEGWAAAGLNHPNVVPLYEAGEAGPVCYLASAYCPGPTLQRWLQQRRAPVSVRAAARLIAALAEGVQHAHSRGVIHRDIKPANVLLQPPPGCPGEEAGFDLDTPGIVPQLTDFGLARIAGQEHHTRTGAMLGTPAYMAPEQASGGPTGPAADVWALGAILYELLTGQLPFHGGTPLVVLSQVIYAEPERPTRLRPDLPRDLEMVCLQCLCKEPGNRYARAADLAADLRRFLEGKPVQARPVPALERAGRWVRRHPAVVVALVALTTLLAASSWFAIQLQEKAHGLQSALSQASEERARAQDSARRARQARYSSDMRLAFEELRAGNPFSLPELLGDHEPVDGEEDFRGFEWYYLRRLARTRPSPLRAHPGRALVVGITADGRWLATAGRGDDTARIWERSTGRCMLTTNCQERVDPPYFGLVTACAAHGKLLASVSRTDRTTVSLWDVASQKLRMRLPHRLDVCAVAFAPDGSMLGAAVGSAVHMWDTPSGRQGGKVSDPGKPIKVLALSPKGFILATTGHATGQVKLWDISAGRVIGTFRNEEMVLSLGFSPDGSLLLVAGEKQIAVWSVREGHSRTLWRCEVPAPVAVFSSTGDVVVTGGDDARVRFWDARTGAARGLLRWQPSPIHALHCSPCGRWIFVGTGNGLVHQVPAVPAQDREECTPDLVPLGPLALSPDEKTLGVADRDRSVKLVDVESGKVHATLPGHTEAIRVAFSPDGRSLASLLDGDPSVYLWDIAKRRLRLTLPREPEEPPGRIGARQRAPTCLAFTSDGSLLAVGYGDGNVRLWSPASGDLRATMARPGVAFRDLTFSPDGRALATCEGSATVSLWDLGDGPPSRSEVNFPFAVDAIAFSPREALIAAGSNVGPIQLVSRARQGVLHWGPTLPGTTAIKQLAFSKDGRLLMGATGNKTIEWWDLASRSRIGILHETPLKLQRLFFALSGDGNRLFTAAARSQVMVRDLRQRTGNLLGGQPPWPLLSLAFSPDGRTLYTGSRDYLVGHRERKRPLGGLLIGPEWWEDARIRGAHSNALRVWDVTKWREKAPLPGTEHWSLPSHIAVAPDGRILAAGAEDGSIWLWNLGERSLPTRIFLSDWAKMYARGMESWDRGFYKLKPEFHTNSETVTALGFSPDGKWLVASGSRGTISGWPVGRWDERRPFPASRHPVHWIGFTYDGKDLVAHDRGKICFWNVRTGAPRDYSMGEAEGPAVTCGGFSPDQRLLVTGNTEQIAQVWDLQTRKRTGQLIGHLDRVSAVAFSQDGRTIATGSWDATVRLWQSATLQALGSLEPFPDKVHCLAFGPDGKTLAVGGDAVARRGNLVLFRVAPP